MCPSFPGSGEERDENPPEENRHHFLVKNAFCRGSRPIIVPAIEPLLRSFSDPGVSWGRFPKERTVHGATPFRDGH